MISKTYVIEVASSSKRKCVESSKGRGGNSKNLKTDCYVCVKVGHRGNNCYSLSNKREPKKKFKGKNKAFTQANMAESGEITEEMDEINLATIISEVNLIRSNPKE